MSRPVLALTQGDPAGIGPEILLAVAAGTVTQPSRRFIPLLVAERAALEAVAGLIPDLDRDRLTYRTHLDGSAADRKQLAALVDEGRVPVLDPIGVPRAVVPGAPTPADAAGALTALDAGAGLAASGVAAALVTAPINKATIARWVDPTFRGHTDHLAHRAGLERYGRDYLMAFLSPRLQVALLTTHLPLRQALEAVRAKPIGEALDCLHRHAGGRIAVAGLNPHAGEGGLLGTEDDAEVRPAVEAARGRGIDAHGPISPDTVFARAARTQGGSGSDGGFDWILALYHDQGLIAVKTAAFGEATNWTLGLPYLRTSVDHGTAYEIAGQGKANAEPLRRVLETTLAMIEGELPYPATKPRVR